MAKKRAYRASHSSGMTTGLFWLSHEEIDETPDLPLSTERRGELPLSDLHARPAFLAQRPELGGEWQRARTVLH